MSLTINSKIKLNNGLEMPLFGLGVYQSTPGEETEEAVIYALKQGYIHIDTAKVYSNEKDVGNAVRKSGVDRKNIFITTKLWNRDQGYDNTLRAFENSLKNLDLDYIDLYLVHFPVSGTRQETWKAMEKIMESGKCKAIGVSNYTVKHMEELLSSCNIKPVVNQVEFSPYLYQKELMDYCHKNQVRITAYSPLTQGKRLNEPILQKIAKKHSKTTAQVLIRWCLEHEIIVIPKSIKNIRIDENANVFDFSLDTEDMNILDNLNENYRVCWDPTDTI
ncbi:MAG: aldo/keto reductase [Candidatus Sericytochromatia bacterium]